MVVTFENALVLDVWSGISKAGRPYGRIKFLSDDLDVFDCMVFGDAVDTLSSIKTHVKYNLPFDVRPARDGGVQMVLHA